MTTTVQYQGETLDIVECEGEWYAQRWRDDSVSQSFVSFADLQAAIQLGILDWTD
jgi:hypothetical protein